MTLNNVWDGRVEVEGGWEVGSGQDGVSGEQVHSRVSCLVWTGQTFLERALLTPGLEEGW